MPYGPSQPHDGVSGVSVLARGPHQDLGVGQSLPEQKALRDSQCGQDGWGKRVSKRGPHNFSFADNL